MLQPRSANSTASQSSSSGCVGGIALASEIVRRADDSLAEMSLPDAIDHHAGQQRIVRRCQPRARALCGAAERRERPSARRSGGPGLSADKKPGLHLFALVLEIAAHQDVGVGNHFFVSQNVGGRVVLGRAEIGFAELLQQRGALRVGRPRRARRGGGIAHRVGDPSVIAPGRRGAASATRRPAPVHVRRARAICFRICAWFSSGKLREAV